jgi:preprotein translocase SecE subunit
VARNRQKAKERQARRKAREQRSARDGAPARDGADGAGAVEPPPSKPEPAPEPPRAEREPAPEPPPAEPEPAPEPAEPEPGDDPGQDPVLDPHLEAGAPPEDVGRSDEVLDYEQDLDAVDEDEEHFDLAEDFPEEDLAAGPTGRREEAERHKNRPRFVQFLFAVWAELQRVQWPDRQALTTLTGVVLGFVLIAGGYLGLLDAIFSRIIQAIL